MSSEPSEGSCRARWGPWLSTMAEAETSKSKRGWRDGSKLTDAQKRENRRNIFLHVQLLTHASLCTNLNLSISKLCQDEELFSMSPAHEVMRSGLARANPKTRETLVVAQLPRPTSKGETKKARRRQLMSKRSTLSTPPPPTQPTSRVPRAPQTTSRARHKDISMPLDQVEEEENSDSSTEQLGRSVELKMPSPTLSASSPEEEDDNGKAGDGIVPPLKATDSWEDADEDEPSKTNSSSLIRKTDAFLKFWTEWSSSSLRTDQGIKLMQWSVWAASALTSPGPPAPGYRGNFRRRYLNPELSPALRKMYLDLSLVRYCLRLYGLPSSIEAIRTGSWSAGWDDPRIHKLGKIMAWSMAIYYPFEHVAFSSWVVPNLLKPYIDGNRWSAVSCRFWVSYIVADLASSVLKLKELGKRREGVAREVQSGVISEDEAEKKRADIAKQVKLQRLHFARNSFFILPAINWSLPKWASDPLLSESFVNGLMLAEAGTSVYQSICAMRG